MSDRPRLLTGPFVIASLANFVTGLALHAYLHIPGFFAELEADEDEIGLLFGLMSGAAIVIRPLTGRVMDRSGRRVVILAGGVLHLAVCALWLTVDRLGPWLLVVRVLQGFAEGALFSSLFTYAADIVPATRRTEGMGLFGVSGMLPISLGGLIGDAVLARANYAALFQVTVALALVALLISLPLKEPPREISKVERGGFLSALTQPDLAPIWFVGSAFSVALAGVFAFLKRYVELEAVGSVGLYFSTYAGAAILLRVLFGWVPDRYGPKRALYPSLLFITGSLLALAVAPSSFWVGVAGALGGLGHGFAFPILSALVVGRANPADRGSAVSLFTAVFDAGILLGAPVLGLVAETSDYRVMYAVGAVVPVVGGAVFAVWDRARPDPPRLVS
ncbi:MAG: MFS transporter [Sandaracinaceae bacterium]